MRDPPEAAVLPLVAGAVVPLGARRLVHRRQVDHAERQLGAWRGVARAARSNERVDAVDSADIIIHGWHAWTSRDLTTISLDTQVSLTADF